MLLFFFSWYLFLRAPRVGNALRVNLKLLVILEAQGWIPRVGDALCASLKLPVTFEAPGMDLELQAWI